MIDYLETLEQLNMSFETLNKILDRAKFNDRIAEYFMTMYESTGNEDYKHSAENIKDCFSKIFSTRYDVSKVIDIQSINHCKSKFCPNCQKLIQATRLNKMVDTLSKDSLNYDLYHMTITVPNVKGKELGYIITVMFEAFSKLIRYFTGNAKIAGVDFKYLGYYAAMRSLEITYNIIRNDYHPHIHCIFALKQGLLLEKKNVNKFSYDAKQNYALVRKFSDLEITLQKLWRKTIDNIILRDNEKIQHKKALSNFEIKYNTSPLTSSQIGKSGLSDIAHFKLPKKTKAQRITLKSLNLLSEEEGFSVTLDKVNDNEYFEVFKYAFKLFDENNTLMQFKQFETLYKVMKNRRQVQCYGAWYDLKLDDSIDLELNSTLYFMIREYLEKEDNEQTTFCATVQDVLEYKAKGYAVISKKQIYKMLDSMTQEQKYILIADVTPLVIAIKNKLKYEKIVKQTLQHFSGIENRYSVPNLSAANMQRKLQEKRDSYRRFILNEEKEEKEEKRMEEAKELNAMTDEQLKMFVNSIF